MNGESLARVTLSANGTPVSAQSSLGNCNRTLTLVSAALAQYTLTVTGVTDLPGNPMS